MRPFEILLSIANLLTFFVFAIPLPRALFWMSNLVPIALLIAIAQTLVEGLRWQMISAYALTGLFFLVWLLRNTLPLDGQVGQILNRVAISLSILGLVVSITLPIILPVFRFPQPSGPFEIGTLTYHWTDASRQEIFSADPNARRELMVQIWYPAKNKSSSPRAPYIQDSDAITTALARLHNFPDFSLKQLQYVITNAAESVPVADDKPNYPVLVFLEGLTGYRQMNTFQVEELVSHGYIVVGIDQPGAAAMVVFPNGHQIVVPSINNVMQPLIHQSFSPAETVPQLNGQAMPIGIIPYFGQDVSFTLDQLASTNIADPKNILTGKLDLQHTGVFGMSLGGTVGAEACLKDPRLKACLIEDVAMTADVVQKGLKQPSMFITRPAATMRLERQTAGGWADKDIVQTQTTMRHVYDSLPRDGYFVQVPGMYHLDLTDLDLLSPIFPTIGFTGPIGSQRAHDIINAYSVAFFDKYLKGIATALLDGPAKQYPEVLFETRRP
jgi:predicted dienelactone hydrolase